jgi:hypothetical protein
VLPCRFSQSALLKSGKLKALILNQDLARVSKVTSHAHSVIIRPGGLVAFTRRWSAWWEVGHRAIARLAAERLTSRARIRVATLLGVPDTVASIADALAAVSTWAEEVRVDTKTGAWHYIDLTLYDKKGDFAKRCHNDNCVTARIRLFREQLKGKRKDPKWTDAEALKFVVHFVATAPRYL